MAKLTFSTEPVFLRKTYKLQLPHCIIYRGILVVKEIYVCDECDFAYKEKELAEKCEKSCRKNHTCNIEITKNSIGELKKIEIKE